MSISNAKVVYRFIVQTAYEMMWPKSFLSEHDFPVQTPIAMHCDNQATIFRANNPTFHKQTKHNEVDCHYVRDMVMRGIISTPYTESFE